MGCLAGEVPPYVDRIHPEVMEQVGIQRSATVGHVAIAVDRKGQKL